MIAFRYIARAFGLAAITSLSGLAAIFLVVDFADRAKIYQGEGWLAAVGELYACKLAMVVWQLAPAAAALGGAVAISALRRTGEVTALRALGRGPAVFAWPISLAAMVVGGLLFAAEDAVVVPASYRAEEITTRRFNRWGDWAVYHRTRRWFRGQDGRVYHLGRADGAAFAEVTLYEFDDDFAIRRRTDIARMEPLEDGRWRLRDVVVRSFEPGGLMREEHLGEQLELFDEDPELFRVRTGRPSQLSRGELPRQIELRRRLGLPFREWELSLYERRAYQLAGVPAALLGMALALRRNRRGHLTAAIAEGVLVTAGLWAASAMAKTLTLAGHLSPLVGGFLPLAGLVAVASWVLWRSSR